MKKLMLFILPLLMLLQGCGKDGDQVAGKRIYRRSFVMEFYKASGLELIIYPETNKALIFFGIIGETDDRRLCDYMDTGARQALYDELCLKYGDMTYNREEFVVYGSEPRFLAYSPVSIDIVSDVDFDAEHPAGTSLNDIVVFDAYSSKPYIDSGYVEYDWGGGMVWQSRQTASLSYI